MSQAAVDQSGGVCGRFSVVSLAYGAVFGGVRIILGRVPTDLNNTPLFVVDCPDLHTAKWGSVRVSEKVSAKGSAKVSEAATAA